MHDKASIAPLKEYNGPVGYPGGKEIHAYRKAAGHRQESMALDQKFGKVIAEDLQARMIEELRKRGFNI